MSGEDGPTLEQGGRDAHAAGDYEGAAAAYEHAFAAYRRDGEVLAAARSARTVGWFRGWVFGDWAVHRGWGARARRLLEAADHDLDRARGWVLLDDALSGSDFHEQRRQYLEAIELARRAGDHDLECDATASLGMMLVFSGLLEEGMAHLDEALAAICGGDVAELPVVEGCLCGMLTACERTHDIGRADEWLRAAQRVMQRGNLVSVAGTAARITPASSSRLVGGATPMTSSPPCSTSCPPGWGSGPAPAAAWRGCASSRAGSRPQKSSSSGSTTTTMPCSLCRGCTLQGPDPN